MKALPVLIGTALLNGRNASAGAAGGPCDILAAAGNPCVAAHSTTRALFSEYDGPLYNVTRSSDGKSTNIGLLAPGGFADKPSHDAFCSPRLDCVISNVFDQTENDNHLGQRHQLVNASRHSVTVGPDKTPVYGMWFDPGFGYHVDNTSGVATGNEPESIYAVMSGKNYNNGCCFDYGNSETNDLDDGCGTMEAIYFGNAHWQGNTGAGATGPWAGADLEQGMYYGGGARTKINNQSQPLPFEFASLSVKGREDGFTIKGGDATQGQLQTMYDGPRPDAKIAGKCIGGSQLSFQQCDPKLHARQQWQFLPNGKSLSNQFGECINIKAKRSTEGSLIWAYPCTVGWGPNEFWKVNGEPQHTAAGTRQATVITMSSEQANTPYCVGVANETSGVVSLDNCSAATSRLVMALVPDSAAAAASTIVQHTSGLCLTSAPPPSSSYQPMHKQGAIILATGGDNSNSAKGTFYEGFMARGYATAEIDTLIQENIVAVGYSGFRFPDQ